MKTITEEQRNGMAAIAKKVGDFEHEQNLTSWHEVHDN